MADHVGCSGCVAQMIFAAIIVTFGIFVVAWFTIQELDNSPCGIYRREVAAHQRALDTNASKDRMLADDWITPEEYDEQTVPVPPLPAEPKGGC